MSPLAQFFLLASIEVGGLFAVWFVLRTKVRRYLELDSLLVGVRDEARALVMELNETADRNVSLVEDRMVALRELLDEADRRIIVGKRELATRENEREVYAKLNKRRPIVPEPADALSSEPARPPPAETTIPQEPAAQEAATLEPASHEPEIRIPGPSVIPGKTKREEALDLHRRGFSADLIAARTGATVAEIELLVGMEESRSAGRGSEP